MGHDDRDGSHGGYNSPIRREQAALTRRRIIEAARTLFGSQGYARTRLKQIAEQAGVSEPTIYAIYRNKRGVLLSIFEDMDMHAGAEQAARDLAAAQGDPARQLEVFVAFDSRLFEREREHLLILRDAATSEPDLASGYNLGRERARNIHVQTFQVWEENGDLRSTLSADRAADLYHAVSSLDAFEYLTSERGWSPKEWEQETLRILLHALLVDRG